MAETTIPDKHQDFCKAVARLCKEHGLDRFGGQFTPGWKDDWRHPVSFSWEQGRHGEDAGRINIQSHVVVHTKIVD